MDNDRPWLDLKYFDDICPDKNGASKASFMNWGSKWGIFQVPVIAVFTKYDQFKRNIKMKLEDENRDLALLDTEVENIFKGQYQAHLSGSPQYVCLESEYGLEPTKMYKTYFCHADMHKNTQQCTDLIEMTADAIAGGAVALILLAIQKNNLELNIKQAIKW